MIAFHFLILPSIRALRLAIGTAAACVLASACFARTPASLAEYPIKNIRMIVAASPSTADDFFARVLSGELEGFYGKRVIVDNRAGAGGLPREHGFCRNSSPKVQ